MPRYVNTGSGLLLPHALVEEERNVVVHSPTQDENGNRHIMVIRAVFQKEAGDVLSLRMRDFLDTWRTILSMKKTRMVMPVHRRLGNLLGPPVDKT
jgi:hypothetical protein